MTLPDYIHNAAQQHRLQSAQQAVAGDARINLRAMSPLTYWGPRSFYLYDTGTLIELYDPQVKALNMAVESGLMPWSMAASELTGMNPIDIIDMIQKDQDLLLSLRVPPEYLQKDPNEIIEVIE